MAKTQLISILRPCSLGLSLTEVSLAYISVKLNQASPRLPERVRAHLCTSPILSAPSPQAMQLHSAVSPGRMCSAVRLEHCTDLNFSALETDFLVI